VLSILFDASKNCPLAKNRIRCPFLFPPREDGELSAEVEPIIALVRANGDMPAGD
jgi:hypothetical protein